ncbi:MAG: TrkH family potassium uptake protein [Alphaproteobacteria bacterium]|nr:TrkH family potassium uptake protein [Alphaproteobacteria bacterium]
MKFQIVGFTLGMLIGIVGLAELVPALIDGMHHHPNAHVFLINAIVCLFFGGGLIITNYSFEKKMSVREAFLLTTLSWGFLAFFAALPLYMSDLDIKFVDAYFEATSGITTTGSTVLYGLDQMSHGVLFWRSMIQWIGGIGIIAFAIVFLPFLRVGGMQLFQTESSDRSDKIMPRSGSVVSAVFKVYCGLTIVCMGTYYALGMSWFDAVNHAMTTVSTAGFSTHDKSFGFFENPALHYSASFFMFASALPFVLFIKFFVRGNFAFWQDEQVRVLSFIVIGIVGAMTFWLWNATDYTFEYCFRHSLFNLVSIITTTGFATTDYMLWGNFAVVAALMATYIGGCAGSTAGGPKIMRIIIAAKVMNRQIKAPLYPNGIFALRYQGKTLDKGVITSTLGFLSFYVVCNVFLTIGIALTGVDFMTAISSAATAVGNVGAGVGPIVGPAGNFSLLPDGAKWLMSFAMMLGRLEILTVFVLFSSIYWRG